MDIVKQMCGNCEIIANIASIDPFALISYAENRVSRKDIALLLPELGNFDKVVGHDFVWHLKIEMDAHNRTLRRGMKMRLVKIFDPSKLLFSSVSDYALQMQSLKLAQALGALCTFGERVASTIFEDQDATFWYISDTLVITRDTWNGLCTHMLRISAGLNRAVQSSSGLCGALLDRRVLELASARVVATFGFPDPFPVPVFPTAVSSSSFRRGLSAEEAALLCDASGRRPGRPRLRLRLASPEKR